MLSSDSEGQKVASRKRQRTSRTSAEDAKKARGRPRVDTQDETAQDVSAVDMHTCSFGPSSRLPESLLFTCVLFREADYGR